MIGIILAPILAAIVQLAYRSYLFRKMHGNSWHVGNSVV